MQHQEAIRVIRKLGPELTKQAAESVLLRYAESEDLAPAQLEKLAQAYNMVRQLSHIDASDDRGSTCHQIDTPGLVKTYVGGTSKAASSLTVVENATHDAGSVDLLLELRREMAPPLTKAASEQPGALEITHPSVPAPSPESDVRYTISQFKEAAWEAKVDFYMVADEVLKMASCEGRTLQLAQAELDASRQMKPVYVAEALNWLEKYAAQQKLSRLLSRHEGPIKVAAFNITTPLADKVVELASAFVTTTLFHKVANARGIAIEDMPTSGRVEETVSDSTMGDVMDMLDREVPDAPPPTEPRSFNPPPSEETHYAREEEDRSSGGGGRGKKKKKSGQDSKDSDSGKSNGHWLASIISGATKPISATADTVGAAAAGAKGALGAVTGKERVHSEQVKLDADIMDIKRSILIRRLAASDPVLRDMPLKDVLDTYNAIAESNPEAAANPRRVLLAMREAASYEGITLDAQKSLGDVRGAAAKTEAQEAENTKRRYSA